LNKTLPVCLFPTPKETIIEIKIRIGGDRKIEILGPVGLIPNGRGNSKGLKGRVLWCSPLSWSEVTLFSFLGAVAFLVI